MGDSPLEVVECLFTDGLPEEPEDREWYVVDEGPRLPNGKRFAVGHM